MFRRMKKKKEFGENTMIGRRKKRGKTRQGFQQLKWYASTATLPFPKV